MLLRLVNDFLSLSDLDSGGVTLSQTAEIDQATFRAEFVKCAEILVREKPIRFEWDVRQDLQAVTGLGLSISRDIVTECFRGRIEVASTPGVGSFFTLWIPRRQPDLEEKLEAEPAAATVATM
jgi:signal transduction histidine kinase